MGDEAGILDFEIHIIHSSNVLHWSLVSEVFQTGEIAGLRVSAECVDSLLLRNERIALIQVLGVVLAAEYGVVETPETLL